MERRIRTEKDVGTELMSKETRGSKPYILRPNRDTTQKTKKKIP